MDGADPTTTNTYIHPHTIMVPQGDADHALIRGADRAQFHPGMELAQRAAGDLHGPALHVGGAGEDGLCMFFWLSLCGWTGRWVGVVVGGAVRSTRVCIKNKIKTERNQTYKPHQGDHAVEDGGVPDLAREGVVGPLSQDGVDGCAQGLKDEALLLCDSWCYWGIRYE